MSRRTLGAACLIGVALSLSVEVHAQRPTTTRKGTAARPHRTASGSSNRFVLGVYTLAAPGISVTSPLGDHAFTTSFGPGAGVSVGYDVNSTITAFAALDLARQGSNIPDLSGTFGLVHFEVGARANLTVGTPTTTPYLMASVGRRSIGARVQTIDAEESWNMGFSGMMLGLGGGIQHTLSPHTMLDAGVELGFGKLGHYHENGEQIEVPVNNSMTTRLRVGVNWRP